MNEPTFTLHASDPFAAAAVERYADLLEANRADVNAISRARHAAQKMRGWLAEQRPLVSSVPSADETPPAFAEGDVPITLPREPIEEQTKSRKRG